MKHTKYKIVGCNLMFGATEQTAKMCSACSLKPTDTECQDDIVVSERHYLYQKIRI